jgi:hypothetical protein
VAKQKKQFIPSHGCLLQCCVPGAEGSEWVGFHCEVGNAKLEQNASGVIYGKKNTVHDHEQLSYRLLWAFFKQAQAGPPPDLFYLVGKQIKK